MSPTKPFQIESEALTPKAQSIANTTPEIKRDAMNTKTEDSCNDFQLGQVTLVRSSS